VAKFEGISFGDGVITYKKNSGPLAGAHAEVEATGAVRSRISLTRTIFSLGLGLLFRKKVDGRELYIKVTGQGFEFVAPVNPKKGKGARTFVAELNSAAMQAAEKGSLGS